MGLLTSGPAVQVGKRLMLLYIQPQCVDVDLTTLACLDKFAVSFLYDFATCVSSTLCHRNLLHQSVQDYILAYLPFTNSFVPKPLEMFMCLAINHMCLGLRHTSNNNVLEPPCSTLLLRQPAILLCRLLSMVLKDGYLRLAST